MPRLVDQQAIFAVTTAVLSERGYDGATTREIARRAKVNEVTLFRRYGKKLDPVRAAIDDSLSSTPFAALEISDNVTRDLHAMLTAFEATTRAHGGLVMTLLTDAARHPELRDASTPLMNNLRAAMHVLDTHQQARRLRREDPWLQLMLLLSPLMAAGLWARAGLPMPTTLNLTRVVSGFLDGHGRPVTPPPAAETTP